MKFVYYCLLSVMCVVNWGSVEVYAQETSLLPAPKWEIGDWWVVEVEMYNSCDVGPSSCRRRWEGPYRYRFEVEGREELDGDDYFVVFIQLVWNVEYYSNGGKSSEGPTQYGACYRVWYRTTDRFLRRYAEYEQWRNGQQVKQRQLDFDPARPLPIMMFYLTKVPVTIPIFDVRQAKTAFTIKNAPPPGNPSSVRSLSEKILQRGERIDPGDSSGSGGGGVSIHPIPFQEQSCHWPYPPVLHACRYSKYTYKTPKCPVLER